jgi:hypothetical protein
VVDVAHVTVRESVDPMGYVAIIFSNADVGTPRGITPGPGAGGSVAINRRSDGLGITMFKQEE